MVIIKVSVIMPIYNSEKTLRRALDSVCNQSYPNVELVAINDGSTDKSKEIVEEYLKKYSSIKLIEESNSGPSIARNIGIKKSTGDYIVFVDSDDYLLENYISEMVNMVTAEEELITCNNKEIYNEYECERKLFEGDNDIINEVASGKGGLICGKLINRNFLIRHNIFFDRSIDINEDQIFLLEIVSKINKYKHIPKSLYIYDRRNNESITKGYIKESFKKQEYVIDKIKGYKVKDNILVNRIYEGIYFAVKVEINSIKLGNIGSTVMNIIKGLKRFRKYEELRKIKPRGKLQKVISISIRVVS